MCIRLHTWIDMGWLRLVGSLKLQVSFAEYSLFYRALLQKRPIILKALLIVATPYAFGWLRVLAMGWLWLVGSIKFLVSFAKERYKRDFILQKRSIILRSLLIVASPYVIGWLRVLANSKRIKFHVCTYM